MQISPALQEPILRCKQVWNNWERLRFVADSHLILGITVALLISLGTCIVRIKIVRVNISCTKSFFILSAEAIIKVCNGRLCAMCAISLLKIKQTPFSCRLAKVCTFFQRFQEQFKMLSEMCIVLPSIVLTERYANLLTVM